MELRHLEYFLAVVEHGGVNRAAEALHVAQPSLSQAIRRFEKDLGTQLFHRVGRRLVLSAAGEALIGPARTVIRDVEVARNAVRDVGNARAGRIDIAALSDMSTDPLSIWVARFRVEHPLVQFRIEEYEDAADVVAQVRSGGCELGLLPLPVAADQLLAERLSPQRFVLVAPPGTEGQWPDPVPWESLSGVPLVMGERGTATTEYVLSTLRARGVEPNIVIEIPQRGAVLPIVQAGGGVAIMPLRIALDARHRGAVIRDFDPPVARRIGALRRDAPLSELATQFLLFSREMVSQWLGALQRRTDEGQSLVDAAADVHHKIDERTREAAAAAGLIQVNVSP